MRNAADGRAVDREPRHLPAPGRKEVAAPRRGQRHCDAVAVRGEIVSGREAPIVNVYAPEAARTLLDEGDDIRRSGPSRVDGRDVGLRLGDGERIADGIAVRVEPPRANPGDARVLGDAQALRNDL